MNGPPKNKLRWWRAAWIPLALFWVVFVVVADFTRKECVEDAECGDDATCVSYDCRCPNIGLRPRTYRCGANADFVLNWADVVSLCFGVAAFFTFIIVTACGEAGDPEDPDTPEAGAREAQALALSAFLVMLGVTFFAVAIWAFETQSVAKTAFSSVAVAAFLVAFLSFMYCWPVKTDEGESSLPTTAPPRKSQRPPQDKRKQ